MIQRKLRFLIGVGALLASTQLPLLAAGTGGCESFEFPLATELKWMTAGETLAATSGTKLDALPTQAIAVTLVPTGDIKFELAPTGKPKNKPENSFAGLLTFAGVPKADFYQVSLSGPGWIDVIQNGQALKAVAHTGKSDCEGLRKSVRFELAPGPFTVQIADVPAVSIKVTVRKAD